MTLLRVICVLVKLPHSGDMLVTFKENSKIYTWFDTATLHLRTCDFSSWSLRQRVAGCLINKSTLPNSSSDLRFSFIVYWGFISWQHLRLLSSWTVCVIVRVCLFTNGYQVDWFSATVSKIDLAHVIGSYMEAMLGGTSLIDPLHGMHLPEPSKYGVRQVLKIQMTLRVKLGLLPVQWQCGSKPLSEKFVYNFF